MYLSSWKFFRNQILLDYSGRWRNQSCQIFFQSVHPGVSGKGSNFAIFSANRRWPLQLLYYRTTVMSCPNVSYVLLPWNDQCGQNNPKSSLCILHYIISYIAENTCRMSWLRWMNTSTETMGRSNGRSWRATISRVSRCISWIWRHNTIKIVRHASYLFSITIVATCFVSSARRFH